MEFNVNSPILFILVAVILLFVVAQCIFFLLRALRRAKELGMDKAKLRKVMRSSAIFTIVPAISIFIGVIALSKKLGIALPWLRLSVIGAITYETPAAEAAAKAVGTSIGDSTVLLTASQFTSITWVMTLGIMAGVILTPLICKGLLGGMDKFKSRDKKWGDILMNSMFMGMISAFLGMIFGDVRDGFSGWIPVFVMLCSAIIMAICGLLIKKLKLKWLEDYALPLSMVGSMALAIPITNAVMSVM